MSLIANSRIASHCVGPGSTVVNLKQCIYNVGKELCTVWLSVLNLLNLFWIKYRYSFSLHWSWFTWNVCTKWLTGMNSEATFFYSRYCYLYRWFVYIKLKSLPYVRLSRRYSPGTSGRLRFQHISCLTRSAHHLPTPSLLPRVHACLKRAEGEGVEKTWATFLWKPQQTVFRGMG